MKCATTTCEKPKFASGLRRSCYNKKHYVENRQYNLDRQKVRRETEPEKVRAAEANWRRANKGKKYATNRRYLKSHPEVKARLEHKRRAAKKGAGGSYTAEEWADMLLAYGARCRRCATETNLTVDHVVPLSKKGTSFIWNLQPLCLSCNCSKGAKVE